MFEEDEVLNELTQKFNLGEIVKTKKTGLKQPGLITTCMSTWVYHNIYGGPNSKSNILYWINVFDEDIIKEPIYLIQYPKPIRPISFTEYCRSNNVEESEVYKSIYLESVPKTVFVVACERDLEFVADDLESWLDTFENREEYEEFVERYENLV